MHWSVSIILILCIGSFFEGVHQTSLSLSKCLIDIVYITVSTVYKSQWFDLIFTFFEAAVSGAPPFYSTDQIIPIFHKLNTPGLKTFFAEFERRWNAGVSPEQSVRAWHSPCWSQQCQVGSFKISTKEENYKMSWRYSGDTGVDTGSRSVVSTAYAYGDYYRWVGAGGFY